MTWHDDSWKDSYDSWKLASPDDDYQDECLHEDYEADVNGRAHCCRCEYSWWLSDDEIKHERETNVAYDCMMRREERRERLDRLLAKLAVWRRWRRRKPNPIDDDIPF